MIKKTYKADDYHFQHPEKHDCERIQIAILERGYEASLKDCAEVWDAYSDQVLSKWAKVPGQTYEIWCCIEDIVLGKAENES